MDSLVYIVYNPCRSRVCGQIQRWSWPNIWTF